MQAVSTGLRIGVLKQWSGCLIRYSRQVLTPGRRWLSRTGPCAHSWHLHQLGLWTRYKERLCRNTPREQLAQVLGGS